MVKITAIIPNKTYKNLQSNELVKTAEIKVGQIIPEKEFPEAATDTAIPRLLENQKDISDISGPKPAAVPKPIITWQKLSKINE